MTTTFAVIALVAVAAAVVALVVLHAAPTGLSPLRDPVSAYGISRWRALYRLQTLATAAAAASAAVALGTSGLSSTTPAIIALVVLAATRAPIGWVPMDADDEPRSATGRAHNLLAYGAFASASVGGFMTGIAFGDADGLSTAAMVVTALGWLMVAASAVTLLALVVKGVRPALGIAERLIYVGMFAWLVVTAVTLIGL